MREPPPGSGPFGATLGMALAAERTNGSVEVSLDARESHHREGGIVHGGVLMTMLDSAMAAAVRRTLQPGQWIASISITTDFVAAAKEGTLVARGEVAKRTRTLAFARGEVHDAGGGLVARGQGIWVVKDARGSRREGR